MCLVGANLNQFKMPLFKTVERKGRCRRIRNAVASGPLCHPAPPPAWSPFWHQRDLCWGLYFRVLSEIMFTKRLFLSVGHPVSVLFGQSASAGKSHPLSLHASCPISEGSLKSHFHVPRVTGPCAAHRSGRPLLGQRSLPPSGPPEEGKDCNRYQNIADLWLSAPVRLNSRQGWEIDFPLARFPLNETGLLPNHWYRTLVKKLVYQ